MLHHSRTNRLQQERLEQPSTYIHTGKSIIEREYALATGMNDIIDACLRLSVASVVILITYFTACSLLSVSVSSGCVH